MAFSTILYRLLNFFFEINWNDKSIPINRELTGRVIKSNIEENIELLKLNKVPRAIKIIGISIGEIDFEKGGEGVALIDASSLKNWLK